MSSGTRNNLNDFVDILFAYKNKSYGAFILRQSAQKRSLTSISLALLLMLLLYLLPLWFYNLKSYSPLEMRQVAVSLTPYTDPIAPPPIPVEPEEIKMAETSAQVSTVKYIKPELKQDHLVSDEDLLPTVDELKKANPGTKTVTGDGDIYAHYDPIIKLPEPEPEPEPVKKAPPAKEKVYSFVQKFPEFPGGEAALVKYLVENIKYPVMALENGIQGNVILQFTVDKEGRIDDIVIVRDIGGGCGQEAVRVVSNMPRWIPGEQQGQKVSVRYTLPVRFQLVN